jgi:predicted NAD/FAD-dependent oxidoreductase
VISVGAGIAGLTLARALQQAGLAPLLLERSRGVGGRCATRRIEGQPVDHGVAYLHGRTAAFRAELEAVPHVVRRERWPSVRDGDGAPCRPDAFASDVYRLAFAEGVNAFPRHLAAGLDIRHDTLVTALHAPAGRSGWRLTLSSGERLHSRAVVLTMPAPSAVDLVAAADPLPAAVERVLPLVRLVRTLPCLTVIARYPFATLDAPWEISLPRESEVLQSVIHDSSKRVHPDRLTLVLQARPAYSRANVDTKTETWTSDLLRAAAERHGTWVAHPEFLQAHIWRKARVAPGTELAQPVVVSLDGGEILAFAGDGFHPSGGVEGAYRSGRVLAERLLPLLTDPAS